MKRVSEKEFDSLLNFKVIGYMDSCDRLLFISI